MAIIDLNPDIPNNIFLIPSTRPREVRAHFERGDVVILTDIRIDADFEFLSNIEPPTGTGARRDKYVFWQMRNKVPSNQEHVWKYFKDGPLRERPSDYRKFQNLVRYVEDQMNDIVKLIFSRNKFSNEIITWKFQRNTGENLHIDNLQGCNEIAQVRVFANLDTKPRHWAVGQHWDHYAERYYDTHSLKECAHNAFEFNGRLNHAAFGPSWGTSDEPRHRIAFDPGEVWLTNSALVAHQVRGGNLMCIAHHEYPYRQYIDRSVSLPSRLKALSRHHSRSPVTLIDRMRGAMTRITR